MNEDKINYIINCIKKFSQVILEYELLKKSKLLKYENLIDLSSITYKDAIVLFN